MRLDLDRVLQRRLQSDAGDTEAIVLLRNVIDCFGESWWRCQRDVRIVELYQRIVEMVER